MERIRTDGVDVIWTESPDELRFAVRESVRSLNLAEDVLSAFLDGLADSGAVRPYVLPDQQGVSQRSPGILYAPRGSEFGGNGTNRYGWAIRDDDLKLIDAIADGIKSAAGVGFFMAGANGSQAASAVVGLLISLFKLLRQVRNKGARLSARHTRILVILRANEREGLTVAEISEILQRADEVTGADVERVLLELSRHTVGDGGVVPLVTQDGTGRWRSNGL